MLHDGELLLRSLTESDWPYLERWNSDPEVLWFSESADVDSYEPAMVREIVRTVSQDSLYFIIEIAREPIGEAWLQVMNLSRVLQRYPGLDCRRIDLMIGEKRWWGHGIGTRVIELLTRYAFEVDQSDAVFGCDIGDRNPRSLRAFQRAGFAIDHVETVAISPKDRECSFDVVRLRS